jgi:hypothetical protein
VAALEGHLEMNLVTDDNFYASRGYNFWDGTLRGLRVGLRELHGFHRGDFCRIPVAYNEDESLAIAVTASDDPRVGRAGEDPETNRKGPATAVAIAESQDSLFDDRPVELWYFVLHVSEDGEVRAELSRPLVADDQDKISEWEERILLGSIVSPDSGSRVRQPASDPKIDVQVSRKSA